MTQQCGSLTNVAQAVDKQTGSWQAELTSVWCDADVVLHHHQQREPLLSALQICHIVFILCTAAKSIMGLVSKHSVKTETVTTSTKLRRGRKKLLKMAVSSPLLDSPEMVRHGAFLSMWGRPHGEDRLRHLRDHQCKACCLCFRFVEEQRRRRRAITSSLKDN